MRSFVLLSLFAGAIGAVPLDQQPLGDSHAEEFLDATQLPLTGASAAGLHGRFLHITGTWRTLGLLLGSPLFQY